jgi:polysaccharide transporter, PST family
MLKKIKKQFKQKEKRILLENFFSLSILQGANYILPLITFPYLVRVLGVDYFGLLAFATATVTYFNILTDYGFNLTATREISLHRENKSKIIEIFSSVMTIKILLMFLSIFLLSILIFSFETFRTNWLIYYFSFGRVIGQVLFPVWVFQGMERMKYITYMNLLAKALFTIAIFIFVKQQNDFFMVPILNSLGFIIAGTLSLVIIKKEFGISFEWQKKEIIFYYFKEGWHVFISRFYVSLYTTTNVFLLGLFTSNTVVGYYSIAEKIVVAIGGLFESANQTIYPYLVKKYKENSKYFYNLLKKIGLIFLAISFMLFLIAEIFRNQIVFLISGEYNSKIIFLLSIFLIRVLMYPFGSLFSNSLIIMQRKKEFMKVMNYTVLIDLIIVPPSIYLFESIGLVCAFIVVLFFHISLLLFYLLKSIKLKNIIK